MERGRESGGEKEGGRARKIPWATENYPFIPAACFKSVKTSQTSKGVLGLLRAFWCPSLVGLGGIGYLDKLVSGARWSSRRPQCLTAN